MDQYWVILGAVVPVFLLVALGVLLRRLGVIAGEADQSLLTLTVWVLMPALILDNLLTNPALRQWDNLLWPPLLGFGSIILGYLAGWWGARLLGLRVGSGRRTFAFCVGVYNYGYIALPLVQQTYGDPAVTGVLFVFNLGVEIAFWTVGIMLVSGNLRGAKLDRLINGPILAVVAGVLLNLAGIGEVVPPVVRASIAWLGQCAVPLALLMTGAVVGDLLGEPGLFRGWRVAAGAVLLRLGLLPLLMLAAAVWLPLPRELRQVLVVQAAMPAGIFPIVAARLYGGSPAVAFQVVASTSVAGLLLIPAWIALGLAWIG